MTDHTFTSRMVIYFFNKNKMSAKAINGCCLVALKIQGQQIKAQNY